MSISLRVVALTSVLFFSACSGADNSTKREMKPQPPMWVVSDADSEVTLYPTLHILPEGIDWKSEDLIKRLADADEVWFEIKPGSQSDPNIQLSALQLGMDPNFSLLSKLNDDEIAKLETAIAPLGMNAQAVDPMKPWMASSLVGIGALLEKGFSPDAGVEAQLEPMVAGKKIRALETAQGQLELLASMPEEIQLELLRQSLADLDDTVELLNELVQDWAVGNVEDLEDELIDEMKAEFPGVYDAVFTSRNENWADQIEKEMKGSGTDFIAVGAGHLVGDDSVQAILKARGYTVKRL